jgi:hypothetical protein
VYYVEEKNEKVWMVSRPAAVKAIMVCMLMRAESDQRSAGAELLQGVRKMNE